MKNKMKLLAAVLIMICAISINSYGEELPAQTETVVYTADMIKAKNPTAYTAGTQSVYGSALNQTELNQVAEAVAAFMNEYQPQNLTEEQKLRAAAEYLRSTSTYAPDWSKNRANTAWGNLVYHQGQCSGYARSFKALCDALDIPCHYVKQNNGPRNGSHQWNIVSLNGSWYNVDMTEYGNLPDMFKDVLYLVSDETMKNFWGGAGRPLTWDASFPACPADFAPQQTSTTTTTTETWSEEWSDPWGGDWDERMDDFWDDEWIGEEDVVWGDVFEW